MKLSVISCVAALLATVGCSATSGDKDSGGNGSGASSSTGNTTGSGAQPNLGMGANGPGPLITGGNADDEPDVANGECAQQNFVVNSKPADVLLVLDRSKSMIEHTVPGGLTRWDAAKAAMTAVITATDASVSWGLKMFPEGEGAECSATSVTDAIPAEIMAGNAATVNGIINTTEALGNGTPTGDAIAAATKYLTARGASNQYIVLATDGDPSCPSSDAEAETLAYTKLAEAKAAGFPVYIIGVLDPVADKSKFTILNQMAVSGGTSRSDNPVGDKFYQAYSQDELTNALLAVTGQVVSCTFEFDSKPPDPTNIAVKINDQKIEQDATKAEGWDYVDDQNLGIILYGQACEQVKDATENHIDVIFGCKGVPIK